MSAEGSTDRLVAALRLADFTALAERAATGEFHDFQSPHAMPQHELVVALNAIPGGGQRAQDLVRRVIHGDFDATKAESDQWAASPEGQAAMRSLGLR